MEARLLNIPVMENKVNGTQSFMAAVLIDSYGSMLMIEINDVGVSIDPADHFIPCNRCGHVVLFSSTADSTPICDHCRNKAEKWTEEYRLHFPNDWSLNHTGGGCMVVYSIPLPRHPKPLIIGINDECVSIYEGNIYNEGVANWSFGDNPTVLMNYLEEYFTAYYDINHLFDDIMTIGKSRVY